MYFCEINCLVSDIRKMLSYNNSYFYKELIYENVDKDLLEEDIGLLINKKLGGILISSSKYNCSILFDNQYLINIYYFSECDQFDNCIITFIINYLY